MEKDYFLIQDKIKEIQSKFLLKDGWLKIYENDSKNLDDSAGLYSCLISKKQLENYDKDYSWPFQMGYEGKPTVYGNNVYKTNDQKGLEPFLFYKSFSLTENYISYFDIAEEFVLYFKLYEDGKSKQNRTFYYVSPYGELEEVIIIEPKLIRVKLKYLKEYLAIRKMIFIVSFDFMRLLDNVPNEWNISYKDELIQDPNFIYSHLIRNVIGKTQSWIMGKVFIRPEKFKKTHYDLETKNEEFIAGYNDNGELNYDNCGAKSSNYFALTFFKKEVLDKYYNDPAKYKVDGSSVSSKFFYLKIDNNVADYVPVFLKELRMLPHNEQLHWKQYNVPIKEGMGMSNSYYKTMIEGN